MSDTPKYTITLRTSENRGDHAADVERSYEPVDGQTVDELVDRLLVGRTRGFLTGQTITQPLISSEIVIRVLSQQPDTEEK